MQRIQRRTTAAKPGPKVGPAGKKKIRTFSLSLAARTRLAAISRNEGISMSQWVERQIMLASPRAIRLSAANGGAVRRIFQRAGERHAYWLDEERTPEECGESGE